MTGNNEAKRPAQIWTDQHPSYWYLLGRYGVREEGWQPIEGMSQTSYASANTRDGQGHVLRIGAMGLTLMATASGALSLDLNVAGQEHLPYRNDGQGVHIEGATRFDDPQTDFRVGVRPENGYMPKGFDAQLYWRKDDDQTVRLLVAPDFCAVVEWGKAPFSGDDPTPGKLTLSSLESLRLARDAFRDRVPPNVEVWEDPRLMHFACAKAHTIRVGGVFHSFSF